MFKKKLYNELCCYHPDYFNSYRIMYIRGRIFLTGSVENGKVTAFTLRIRQIVGSDLNPEISYTV